ncbi:MAG TPA: DUF4391 domain-containing protein [Gallicola sp.]|nr:DUF4391 domain-containing protein [Gallicola sp.]
MFDLPKSCLVNKFIPKKAFYEKTTIATNVKKEFVDVVEKIIWLYKLSPDTIGINKTSNVEEIQIFELHLKEKTIPKNVIKTITKIIPYPILFIIKYNDEIRFSIKVNDNYFTEWNEQIPFDFKGINLEYIYEEIVKVIIKETKDNVKFEEILINKTKKDELIQQIQIIKNKMKNEKQFNKKVELNKKLRLLEKEMEELVNG